MIRRPVIILFLSVVLLAVAIASRLAASWFSTSVTGKGIVSSGHAQGLGSLPTALLEVPGGRWAIVAATGRRQQLTTLDRKTGLVASVLAIPAKDAIYGPMAADGNSRVYVPRGYQDQLSVFDIDSKGRLSESARIPIVSQAAPEGWARFAGGVAVTASGKWAFVALNATSAYTHFKGSVAIIDLVHKRPKATFETKGFPLAILLEGSRLFVASERDDCVEVFDVRDPEHVRTETSIPVGKHPISLKIDSELQRLYVANANSDTLSIIDTKRLVVGKTLLLRPKEALDLPGATPVDIAIDKHRNELYVPLADMNAVAIVRRSDLKLQGLLPTANYPAAASTAVDGTILVACAKGDRARVPNNVAVGPAGAWGREVLAIQEGTLETIPREAQSHLAGATSLVAKANLLNPDWKDRVDSQYRRLRSLGVQHVIYVVKENRTYDQVLGDVAEGNGDPSLTDFGRAITPNHHALAKRFVLLDNFYCCADVSADGWTCSVAGMIPNYNVRNTPVLYSNRGRTYDFEGQNNGTAVEFLGYNDVAKAPGGYLWDLCLARGLSFRNYGFYVSTADPDEIGPDGKYLNEAGRAAVLALDKHTDREFGFGMDYADSDLHLLDHCASPKQRLEFGAYKSKSRMMEWLREFRKFDAANTLPALTFLTLQRDHTAGNTPGLHTPSAMVADNDYALGVLVQTISNSKFWKSTAIIVVEDDASNGYDHVDCHRSLCLVISPLVPKGIVDHRFGNTVSAIRTIEALLGLPAMNQYDRFSMPLACLSSTDGNVEPYAAILPSKRIASTVNSANAYRANEFTVADFRRPDSVDEDDLLDIIRHDSRQ